MNDKEFQKMNVEFTIATEDTFSVKVVAWNNKKYSYNFKEIIGEKWNWNVYAYIYDTHPLFLEPERAKGLPFHWGATYDKYIITTPSVFMYDFDRISSVLKLGSDYAHCDDDHDNHPSPMDGIPWFIDRDTKELLDALEDA